MGRQNLNNGPIQAQPKNRPKHKQNVRLSYMFENLSNGNESTLCCLKIRLVAGRAMFIVDGNAPKSLPGRSPCTNSRDMTQGRQIRVCTKKLVRTPEICNSIRDKLVIPSLEVILRLASNQDKPRG